MRKSSYDFKLYLMHLPWPDFGPNGLWQGFSSGGAAMARRAKWLSAAEGWPKGPDRGALAPKGRANSEPCSIAPAAPLKRAAGSP